MIGCAVALLCSIAISRARRFRKKIDWRGFFDLYADIRPLLMPLRRLCVARSCRVSCNERRRFASDQAADLSAAACVDYRMAMVAINARTKRNRCGSPDSRGSCLPPEEAVWPRIVANAVAGCPIILSRISVAIELCQCVRARSRATFMCPK